MRERFDSLVAGGNNEQQRYEIIYKITAMLLLFSAAAYAMLKGKEDHDDPRICQIQPHWPS